MFIGICDDDNIMRERIERVCKDVTKKYNEETIIKKYKDGQEITDQNIDILILDIEMPMVGGIAVKERLDFSDQMEKYLVELTSMFQRKRGRK